MPTVGSAFDYLTAQAPAMFGLFAKSLLYVGHRGDTHPWWHKTFAPIIGAERIAVIDIDRGNLGTAGHVTQELYHGDIRQTDAPSGFGVVFWDEGPEHVSREDALHIIGILMQKNTHVLISCPWGYQPQGHGPSDPEFHHWGPMPEDFESIGMQTRTFGTMFDGTPGRHGNLIAWV